MIFRRLRMRSNCGVGSSAIMAAAVSDLELCCLAYEAKIDKVKSVLVESPELINKRDSHQRTALHWACVSGHIDIVKLLISHGAEV